MISCSNSKIKLEAGLMCAGSSGVSEWQQGHWVLAESVSHLMQAAHRTALQGSSTGWERISV